MCKIFSVFQKILQALLRFVFCCCSKEEPTGQSEDRVSSRVHIPEQLSAPVIVSSRPERVQNDLESSSGSTSSQGYGATDEILRKEEALAIASNEKRHEELAKKREKRWEDFKRKADLHDAESAKKRLQKEQETNRKFQEDLKKIRENNEQQNADIERGAFVNYGMTEEESKKENELNIQKINEEMEEDRQRFEKKMDILNEEARQEDHEFKRNIIQIEEALLKKREERRKEAEFRRRQMNEQMEKIERFMRQKVWNEVCEGNWTDRLNMLRDANKDLKEMENLVFKGHFKKERIPEFIEVLEILKKLMRDEDENMKKAFQFSRKEFVLEIQKCVQLIAEKADSLIWGLQIHEDDVLRLNSMAAALNRACLDIPSLAELKDKYYNEMRMENA